MTVYLATEVEVPPLIGLMGPKRSGKDTVAGMLVPHGFQRVAFADAIRDSLMALDPFLPPPANERLSIILKRYGWDAAKETFPEVRSLLQRFGAEAGRDILGEDIWLRIAANKLNEAEGKGQSVVVTDVRFINEARMIIARGGFLIRVDRPGLPDDDAHVSEQEWRKIPPNVIVANDDTLDVLQKRVDQVVTWLNTARGEAAA